jgi:uncharacterized membrane protein YjdF
MFNKEDQDEILRLAKVAVATKNDMDSIYELLKRYIRPNAVMYQTNCNCNTSISAYYQLLIEWYSKNADKFNQPEVKVTTKTKTK